MKTKTYQLRFFGFFAAVVVFYLAANFAHPVTPTVIKELNLNDYMFGVALAAMQLTNFLMSPFWGKINRYISSRVSLMICACGYGAAQIMFANAETEFAIIIARMVAGLFTGGVMVSVLTYVVNAARPEDQGKYLTYSATIRSVASAFGYMVGGVIGEFSVKGAFFVQAGTLVAVAVFFYLVCQPDGEYSLQELSGKQLIREANPFQAFIDSRKFMTAAFALLFSVNILFNFANTGFDQAFNYYLKDQLGLTSAYNGMIKAGVGLISFVFNLTICIWIIKHANLKKSLVTLAGVCMISALGTVVSAPIGIFIVFSILVYAGYSVSVPVLQHMIASSSSPQQKNLVMGFFNATQSLGSIVGSLTAGFIYSLDVKMPFICTFVIYGLGGVAAWIYLCRKEVKTR